MKFVLQKGQGMFKYIIIIGILIVAISVIPNQSYSTSDAQLSEPDGYHVLELFTSQSCSSCPAADAFLEELDKNENIIALSCNVTYWNHLNWQDTLSQDFCTDKQRQYSYIQNRNGLVFTPELMINGEKSFIGSKRGKIVDYLSHDTNAVMSLKLELKDEEVTVAALNDNTQWDSDNIVTLIAYGDKHTQFVPSGENRGRTIHYSNPVLSMKKIAQNWNGSSPISSSINSDTPPSGYVVLVSSKNVGGKILGAGKIKL